MSKPIQYQVIQPNTLVQFAKVVYLTKRMQYYSRSIQHIHANCKGKEPSKKAILSIIVYVALTVATAYELWAVVFPERAKILQAFNRKQLPAI